MRAINHALTGSIIGLIIGEPLVAVPVALASHFVCDAIPHYDGLNAKPSFKAMQAWHRTKLFRRLLYADALLCFALVIVLAFRHPVHWQLAAICAFIAASPDFMSVNLYKNRNADHLEPFRGYYKFASAIQWFQRPIGAVVDVAWFIAAVVILVPFLT